MPEYAVELMKLFGPMGFIMWLVWRTTNHTIPRLANAFETAVGRLQESYIDQSDKQRADFKEVIQQQRSDFREIIEREQEAHAKQTDRLVEAIHGVRDATG
jgi:hypothetical protein